MARYTAAEKVTHDVNVSEAIELRKAGATLEAIAQRLGWNSRQAVHEAIKDRLAQVRHAGVEELRALTAERLDAMLIAVYPDATRGNLKAIEVVLKIEAQRARLFGLDAPVRTEVTGIGGGPIEVSDISDLVARIFEGAISDAGGDELGAIEVVDGGPLTLIEGGGPVEP